MTTVPIEDDLARRSGWLVRQAGTDAREAHLLEEEQRRVHDVVLRRMYYDGGQYDAKNRDTAAAESLAEVRLLPEHYKVHAYSTQIQDSVDFIAAQLSEDFKIEAADPTVQSTLMAALLASPDLSAGEDEDDLSVTNVLRDALGAGDVPVHVRWDEVDGTAWFEFWESEGVEFRYQEGNRHRLEKVIVTERVWKYGIGDEIQEKTQATTYEMLGGECARTIQVDNEEPGAPEFIGLPFIPWCLLRANKKRLRATRGESIITDQAMKSADRYNSVEQTSYLIARYNSHGNLVVVGDAAVMQSNEQGHVSKDVADVLTFPGGTQAIPIVLPTDPQMIEHQREVLLDSLYGSFGLVRLDPGTVQGMGQVSGYALEILNRKTEATFTQIGKQWTRDLQAMLNLALDVTAYKATEESDLIGDDETPGLIAAQPVDEPVDMEMLQIAVLTRMLAIDPAAEFPNRKVEIRMGNGYIVDDVMIRDDFVAGLVSLEEALRLRGYDDDDIVRIVGEIDARKPPEPEVGLSPAAAVAARQAGSSTKAASTLGTATATGRSA